MDCIKGYFKKVKPSIEERADKESSVGSRDIQKGG